jgi:hypothetical protein
MKPHPPYFTPAAKAHLVDPKLEVTVLPTLMDCVLEAIKVRGWILNPNPFEGLVELPAFQ